MLTRLLELIRQEGNIHVGQLAERLDTTPALVEQMLAHLERAGVLKAIQSCEPSHCQGCQAAKLCNHTSPRAWTIQS